MDLTDAVMTFMALIPKGAHSIEMVSAIACSAAFDAQ